MRCAIKLEMIGAYGSKEYIGGWNKSKPWVARIHGFHDYYGYDREFMRARWDYSQANSTGSRGIYALYALEPGVYEINERISRKRQRRYFILVADTELHDAEYWEITQEEVDEWLKENATSE